MEKYKKISLDFTSNIRKKSKKAYEVITADYFTGKIVYIGFFIYKNKKERDSIFEKLVKEKHSGHLSRQHESRTFEQFFRDDDYESIDDEQIMYSLILDSEENYKKKILKKIKKIEDEFLVKISIDDIYIPKYYIN